MDRGRAARHEPGFLSASPIFAVLERNFQELLYTLCEEFRRSEFFIRDQKALAEIDFLTGKPPE